MYPSRARAAAIARDTLQILDAGQYTNRAGEVVAVSPLLEEARVGTVTYPPDSPLPRLTRTDRPTVYEVVNDTTRAAARKLVADGYSPVALNFA